MTLSIITINLNNLEGLKKTRNSIAIQSFRDLEWIVCDGGSIDGSKEFLEEHESEISYWISQKDKGIYNAMNHGIEHAKGEWLLFLNSGDSLYDENTLHFVFSEPHDTEVLYGNYKRIVHKGQTTIIDGIYDDKLDIDKLTHFNICHQASFYHHSCFDHLRYDETYHICADYLLNVTLLNNGKRFLHINQFICYYDADGISTNSTILLPELARIYDQIALQIIKQGDSNPFFYHELIRRNSCRHILKMAGKLAIFTNRILKRLEKFTT